MEYFTTMAKKKQVDTKSMRDMTEKELHDKLTKLQIEWITAKAKQGKEKNTRVAGGLRREIARVLTVLGEKELI